MVSLSSSEMVAGDRTANERAGEPAGQRCESEIATSMDADTLGLVGEPPEHLSRSTMPSVPALS